MSLSLFDYGVRLRATAERKALPTATMSRVGIRSDALVISLVAMSGEHAGTWALAVGSRNSKKPVKVVACPDPSEIKDQRKMWAELASVFTSHVRVAHERGLAPQLVVASQRCWEVLAETAARLVYTQDAPEVVHFARIVLFANERAALAGDPTVVRMAPLLSEIYTCGGDDTNADNLQSVMAWITGDDDGELDDALARADEDNDCSLPREIEDRDFYVSFRRAMTAKDPSERSNTAAIHKKNLLPIIRPRWFRLKDAVDLYERAGLITNKETEALSAMAAGDWGYAISKQVFLAPAPLPNNSSKTGNPSKTDNGKDPSSSGDRVSGDRVSGDRASDDRDSLPVNDSRELLIASLDVSPDDVSSGEGESEGASSDNGAPSAASRERQSSIRRYDSAKSALRKLASREAHADQWDKTLLWRDDHYQRRAFADGRLLIGEVQGLDGNVAHVVVGHDMLRIRKGDELVSFDNPALTVRVMSMERIDDLRMMVSVVGDPDACVGTLVRYGPREPDPSMVKGSLMRRALAQKRLGWTHSDYHKPPVPTLGIAKTGIMEMVNGARVERN